GRAGRAHGRGSPGDLRGGAGAGAGRGWTPGPPRGRRARAATPFWRPPATPDRRLVLLSGAHRGPVGPSSGNIVGKRQAASGRREGVEGTIAVAGSPRCCPYARYAGRT